MTFRREFRLLIGKYVGGFYEFLENEYCRYLYSTYRKNFQLAPTFRFNGPGILFYGEGQIICGEDSYVGSYTYFQTAKDTIIFVGKNCAISHNVKVYTNTFITDQDFNASEREFVKGNVHIGDGVWIGVNTYISPGITIGDNAIVGANSVVTKDIPPFAVVGGVPAEIIRYKNL